MQMFIVDTFKNLEFFKNHTYSVSSSTECYHDLKLIQRGDLIVAVNSRDANQIVGIGYCSDVLIGHIKEGDIPRLNVTETVLITYKQLTPLEIRDDLLRDASQHLEKAIDGCFLFMNGVATSDVLIRDGFPVIRAIPQNFPEFISTMNAAVKSCNYRG